MNEEDRTSKHIHIHDDEGKPSRLSDLTALLSVLIIIAMMAYTYFTQ